MQTIDLQKIINLQELNTTHLGKLLFPKTKYPYLAIHRVAKGKALLDSHQVCLLSEYTGIPVGFLYSCGKWKHSVKENTVRLTSGEITAELNTETWETTLFKNGEKYADKILFSPNVGLSVYISHLTDLIIKNK